MFGRSRLQFVDVVGEGASSGDICYLSDGEELKAYTGTKSFIAFTVNVANCAQVYAGESIYICLESESEQAPLAAISTVKLTAEGTDAAQTVVSDGLAASLSSGSCVAGKCKYEVVLNQVMFEAISADDTTTTLSVGGTAVMGLGSLRDEGVATVMEVEDSGTRRNLKIAASKEERSLEKMVGDIRGEFEVVAADGAGSSASTRLGGGGMLITTFIVATFNLL
jgi:hypothetical protein